jgi:hypothetical protein
LQQKLLLNLYLALRYKEALNKIAGQSNICPFLDIKFKDLRVYKKASEFAVTGFFVFEGGKLVKKSPVDKKRCFKHTAIA